MKPWIKLESDDLWLFTDGRLYWLNDNPNEPLRAGSGDFAAEAKRLSVGFRQTWLNAIERWQANNDSLRATGDPLYSQASSYAAILKS
jgi:hypothetical protein